MAPLINSHTLSGLSPLTLDRILSARDAAAQSSNYRPGSGTVNPITINNNAIFALFGLLGAGFVISSIWFFFWAKNGGFRWRKKDWEDYKSTVLRRKGPNGTTLSGATKSTKLGDGSIVGSLGSMDEISLKSGAKGKKKRGKQVKNSQDKDVRAYRHEKVAKVGGLNKEAEGSYTNPTTTAGSETHYSGAVPSEGVPRRSGAKRTSRRDFAYPQSESGFSVVSEESHQHPLQRDRRSQQNNSSNNTPPAYSAAQYQNQKPIRNVPKSTNGRYSSRTSNGGYTEPLDFNSRYEGSVDGSNSEQVRNTKAYHHPIPGLSRTSNAGGGFRRDGGRRDSLGDSDGETR